jgi:membrane glycosyltransferase
MPICNENVARLFAGLEASYRSLARTSELRHFDFYVFSDISDPERQVEEEVAWAQGRQTRAMKNSTVRAADRSSSAEVCWQTS